jgi:hypothetical protein
MRRRTDGDGYKETGFGTRKSNRTQRHRMRNKTEWRTGFRTWNEEYITICIMNQRLCCTKCTVCMHSLAGKTHIKYAVLLGDLPDSNHRAAKK